MIRLVLSQLVAIILIAICDITIIPGLSFGSSHIHIFPLALIFVFLLSNIRLASIWVLVGGLLLEIFSFGGYGFHIAGLLISLACIVLLFERVMTNRSVYSVSTVAVIISLIYNFSLLLQASSTDGQVIHWKTFFSNQAFVSLYSALISVIIFYLINAVTRRLRPVFLAKKDYRL